MNPNLTHRQTVRRRALVGAFLVGGWLLLFPTGAFAIYGTFTVTESWTATLTYSQWGDQNYSGTKQFSGTQSGTIDVAAGGGFTMLDQSGIPHDPPAGAGRTRTLNFDGSQYRVNGDKVMPYLLAGVSLYGILYLGEFVVNVPLVDGEIPVFYNYTSFHSSGSSLSSISGSGSMTGSSLTVFVTSTSTWTPVLGVPTVTTDPIDRSAVPGASTSFNVSAIGNPAPAYQWQRLAFGSGVWTNLSNSGAYSGVTTPTLTVSGISPGMSGDQFRCVVDNAYGPVTSGTGTLTVLAPPLITSQPVSQTVLRGSDATFAVLATGELPLSYQWRKGAVNVVGATNFSYTINNVQTSHAGNYSVTVSNLNGGVLSSNAALAVLYPPVLSMPRVSGANFLFLLTAPPGSTNVLQTSTDLLNWTTMSTSTIPTGGVVTFTNSTVGASRRAYRVYLK
jgi:Immunoglobulin domain